MGGWSSGSTATHVLFWAQKPTPDRRITRGASKIGRDPAAPARRGVAYTVHFSEFGGCAIGFLKSKVSRSSIICDCVL